MTKTHKISKEIKKIYGREPRVPVHLYGEITLADDGYSGGYARYEERDIIAEYESSTFRFSVKSVMPNASAKAIILHIENEENIPNRHTPCEEIADMGYGVASIFTEKISKPDDRSERKTSLAKLSSNGQRQGRAGSLMLYAFAVHLTAECIKHEYPECSVGVIGNGYLAEAALLAAAIYENIDFALLNGISDEKNRYDLFGKEYNGLYKLEERVELLCEFASDKRIIFGFAKDGDLSPISLIKDRKVLLRDGTPDLSLRDWRGFLESKDEKTGRQKCKV